MYSE